MKQWKLKILKYVVMMNLILIAIPYEGRTQEHRASGNTEVIRIASPDEGIKIALEHNRRRHRSRYAIEIAEAQHQQALSAYWPQLNATMAATRHDEDRNFLFPEEVSTYNIAGLAPAPMDVRVRVPEKDVKHLDRDLISGSLNVLYPLYTGGKRDAFAEQTATGVQIAREADRQTHLRIIYDVKRIYFGRVLASKLRVLGQETLERVEATRALTERIYQTGSGTVKKTDYLRTQMMAASARALLETLQSNENLATAALVNVLGLPWESSLELTDTEIPFVLFNAEVTNLIAEAHQFNPEWNRLALALTVTEAKIQEAKSGHLPTIALTGNLAHLAQTYDAGVMTDKNRTSWNVGVVMEFPLFTGFRTTYQIKEARLRAEQLQQEQMLFSEGLALQIKDALLQIDRAEGQVEALRESVVLATENRELNVRAYQHDLVETREVLEAQLIEAFIKGQYFRALHDHVVSRAALDWLIGRELEKRFQ